MSAEVAKASAKVAPTSSQFSLEDMDGVFYDAGGPGEGDGLPWAFAPADSTLCERFATKEEAEVYAARWVARRAELGGS